MSPRERSQLIDALIEGDLSEADFLRVEAELSIDPAARAEYYQRLALTASLEAEATAQPNFAPRLIPLRPATQGWIPQFAALAAALALVAVGWWGLRVWHPAGKKGTTSKAVAMLNRVVDAEWVSVSDGPKLSAPLEPGWLRLKSGLAQVVFYSGARVVIDPTPRCSIATLCVAASRHYRAYRVCRAGRRSPARVSPGRRPGTSRRRGAPRGPGRRAPAPG